jgi:hypothetical protein
MWVASYGVIPQTYIEADVAEPTTTGCFVEVSKTLGSGLLPGRPGSAGAVQGCMMRL